MVSPLHVHMRPFFHLREFKEWRRRTETTIDGTLEARTNTEGRNELIEMHLLDADARQEEDLCGA